MQKTKTPCGSQLKHDPFVDKPSHYTATTIEAIDYISDTLQDGYGF